ncbi:MAG: FHA domain-containing protein, partial [Verrucomicrobiae bacterium]|nr:FHA domain-containing protein [Verrucomicrobiae bacterium]
VGSEMCIRDSCVVIVTNSSVRVRDLGTTNGTWIDNRRVLDAELRHGQILMLGSMEMRLLFTPVEIAIPPLPVPKEPVQTVLEDGRVACLNHPGIEATFKCTQCGRAYCNTCVRELHLVGGKSRLFCPACSGVCEALVGIAVGEKRRSFASRLLDTIRIYFKKGGTQGGNQ